MDDGGYSAFFFLFSTRLHLYLECSFLPQLTSVKQTCARVYFHGDSKSRRVNNQDIKINHHKASQNSNTFLEEGWQYSPHPNASTSLAYLHHDFLNLWSTAVSFSPSIQLSRSHFSSSIILWDLVLFLPTCPMTVPWADEWGSSPAWALHSWPISLHHLLHEELTGWQNPKLWPLLGSGLSHMMMQCSFLASVSSTEELWP